MLPLPLVTTSSAGFMITPRRCDNLVFFGLILALLTYLYILYFVAYISMFPFHQYQSEV